MTIKTSNRKPLTDMVEDILRQLETAEERWKEDEPRIRQQVIEYEQRYGVRSEDLQDRLEDGTIAENEGVDDWQHLLLVLNHARR